MVVNILVQADLYSQSNICAYLCG